MYRILCGGIEVYNDAALTDTNKLINPVLDLEDSAAGSLKITVPPGNAGYSTIERLTSDVTVIKNGQEIWWGRVLSEERDFWNDRILTCEGALAFLNDVSQPIAQYTNLTIRDYLVQLISVYNSHASPIRQFSVGAVTVTTPSPNNYTTNYEKTIECVNKLIDNHNGHLRVTKQNGVYILDYLADYPNTNSQTIQFGTNLLDFTRKWRSEEFATVLVPLGDRLEESQYEDIDERLTVASVNSGSIYVVSSSAVSSYGWIEKVVTFDGVTAADQLLAMAQVYLADIQFDKIELELSAVDLSYLDINYESIKLLDRVRAVSVPHGMNHLFPVRKMHIPLDSPENTTFTLGDTQTTSLTGVNNQVNQSLLDKIKNLPSKQTMLDAAKANATAIMNQATNGYITIHQNSNGTDAIYISDERDYTQAERLWKWNMNGLAYSDDGGETWGLAITMDGAIVADFITAGTLNGDLIQAGTIEAEALSVEYTSSVASDIADGDAAVTQAFQAADGQLSSRITSAEGNISTLSQTASGLTASVSSLDGRMSSVELTLTGVVFTSNLTDGVTTISGDNITTGTINGADIRLNKVSGGLGGSELWFEDDNNNPYGYLRLDNSGAGTAVETQDRVVLETLPGTSIKIASGSGASMTAQQIFEKGNNYVTLESGGYYGQSGGTYSWVRGEVNIGNANTYNQSAGMDCQIKLWGTASVNGYPIITLQNISQYIPSSSTAVFG